MSEEGYTPERYRPVEEFIKSNKDRLRTRFLEGQLTENLDAWQIDRRSYNELVDTVLEIDSSSIASFMSEYARAAMDKRQGLMEKKRQLLLDVQNLILGNSNFK
jgi:hypothetical protein